MSDTPPAPPALKEIRSGSFQPILFNVIGVVIIGAAILMVLSERTISWPSGIGIFTGGASILNGWNLARSKFAVLADGSFSWTGHDGKERIWSGAQVKRSELATLSYKGISELRLNVHLTDGSTVVIKGLSNDKVRSIIKILPDR